jgi:hypothetical protein
MSYKLKILLVFDTNSIRDTDNGAVVYKDFSLGGTFRFVENFIEKYNLKDYIHIAIPRMSLDEIKDQKLRSFKDDIVELKNIIKRMEGIPNLKIEPLNVSEELLNIENYIESKKGTFLTSKNIQFLEITPEQAHSVLSSMIQRVLKDPSAKAPFIATGKDNRIKDAGFKDNIVWESLLNYSEIEKYDKVIFITSDSGFSNVCKTEFNSKWAKHFEILGSDEKIESELRNDFENFINERDIFDYTDTYYFSDYLFKELKNKSVILLDDKQINIENFKIDNYCVRVEREKDEDGNFNLVSIVSKITINCNDNGEKKDIEIEAYTDIEEDPLGPVETTFSTELN